MADYSFALGKVARVPFEVTDLAGNFVDPAQVRCKVRAPGQAITTYVFPADPEIVKDSTGKYRIDVYLDEPGEWRVRWEGRNTNRTADEVSIHAVKSAFYDRSGAELPDS